MYKQLNEEMKFLWTKDLKINTAHVVDVARALWFVAAPVEHKGGRKGPVQSVEIYNVVDKGDTGNFLYLYRSRNGEQIYRENLRYKNRLSRNNDFSICKSRY